MIPYLYAPQAEYGLIEGVAGTNRVLIAFLLVLTLTVVGNFPDAMLAIVIVQRRPCAR